jgi:transglutaminase-like putative cysteine protease
MNFTTLYRTSFYTMLVCATLVLSIDASESRIAMLYPPAVAMASMLAFLTVDRNPKLGLTGGVGDLLALATVGLFLLEYNLEGQLIVSLGHWLVYLEITLMFRSKTVEQDWYLFGLSLVQVLVGTVISQSDLVGAMLFTWAILALWVLVLFSLRRDAVRASGESGSPPIPGGNAKETYPGLLNVPFLLSGVRVMLITLALGGAIFLAMPRSSGAIRSPGGDAHLQHLTGFDDEVQLGQLGEILESDDVVMSIELFDSKDNRISLPGEPLWRGVTLDVYRDSRWFRQRRLDAPRRLPSRSSGSARPRWTTPIVRQQIKLEGNDSNVLFGVRPMIEATLNRRASRANLNPLDGSIYLPDFRSGSFDYEVVSYLDPTLPQPGEDPPSAQRLNDLMKVPDGLRPRLKEIAERVIERTVPEANRNDPRAKARALEVYLRDSGEFGYTLKLDRIDTTIDPVEDFLINRKQGHCEYFASALALMLRSVGVPARMVNGFKGGDWNELAQVLNVREKHAHSWVEAYMGEGRSRERSPEWLTLDPTPGAARDESVASVSGFKGNFRQLSDLVRYIWVFYIVGYNAERQNRLLYGPIRRLAQEARRGFRMMAAAASSAKAALLKLLHFPTVEAFISVRGFVVSFIALLILAGVMKLISVVVRRLIRWYRGDDSEIGPLSAGAAQYRRLAQLLAEFGLERPPAETQDEFARRAAIYLNGQASDSGSVADVPREVVEAYYRVRFGNLDLVPDSQKRLDNRLDDLEAVMRVRPT